MHIKCISHLKKNTSSSRVVVENEYSAPSSVCTVKVVDANMRMN
jgi:hypothetical protein